MWFILLPLFFFLFLLLIGSKNLTRSKNHRRLQLIELINLHKIDRIEWHHRGQLFFITLTTKSIAKASRNRDRGIGESIIIKHFWLEGKLCNTDSFLMDKIGFRTAKS
jgi:hypothetical protein